MLEQYLIEHCSPTLASLKTANLINVPCRSFEELYSSVEEINKKLYSKGVELIILKEEKNSALIYVCRKTKLSRDLENPAVAEFLAEYGYTDFDVDSCIDRLRETLNSGEGFPHEIGVFLGYPPDDVRGFIRNGGKNCKCCGCWKVYCNECEAVKIFERYNKCKRIYCKLWLQGSSLSKLTVAQ